MDRTELVQVTTLWFVVLIFLQSGSGGGGNPLLVVAAIVAILLSYLLPLYVLAGLAGTMLGD